MLTEREIQVLILSGDGLMASEIGVRLGIAHGTARTHQWNLRRKLGARNMAHALTLAYRAGMIEPAEGTARAVDRKSA